MVLDINVVILSRFLIVLIIIERSVFLLFFMNRKIRKFFLDDVVDFDNFKKSFFF